MSVHDALKAAPILFGETSLENIKEITKARGTILDNAPKMVVWIQKALPWLKKMYEQKEMLYGDNEWIRKNFPEIDFDKIQKDLRELKKLVSEAEEN